MKTFKLQQSLAAVNVVQPWDCLASAWSVTFRLLSDNQKVKLLLNHFTPGDSYEFAHQVARNGANKWLI